MVRAEPDIRVRGQVAHDVGARHLRRHALALPRVAAHEPEPGIRQRRLDELLLAGREVVVADDVVPITSRRSTRLLPMNPAAPVTKTRISVKPVTHYS